MDNIRTVAVVGAGISGVCAAAHLLKQGLTVTVYERSSISGGVWHFDPRSAHEPDYPNERPSKGDYKRFEVNEIGTEAYATPPATPRRSSAPSEGSETSDEGLHSLAKDELDPSIAHAPPGPCYAGLNNNVSLTCMRTSLYDWPTGLEEFVNQRYLEEYIQGTARTWNVDKVTEYNTRVDDVRKVDAKWRVITTTLDSTTLLLRPRTKWFDAVVIASGHYNMPRIPQIPGLKDWKHRYPDRIMHSKGYRNASKYKSKRVLLVGAGVSSMDIAKEIVLAGGTVIQSSRGGMFDLPPTMLPEQNARRIGGVSEFVLDSDTSENSLDAGQSLPGHVLLGSGEVISGLDYIILGTGYISSYSFLPRLHSDNTAAEEVDEHLLVTREGDMVHNLYRDIFYMPDPTLSFIGTPYHISTFSLFDFQAQVVARVLSGRARLPSQSDMRAQYHLKVRDKGYGREFHSLRADGAEIAYVADLVEWMNLGLDPGAERMQGHTEAWLAGHRLQREMLKARRVVIDKRSSDA